jgi:hypothetical protein
MSVSSWSSERPGKRPGKLPSQLRKGCTAKGDKMRKYYNIIEHKGGTERVCIANIPVRRIEEAEFVARSLTEIAEESAWRWGRSSTTYSVRLIEDSTAKETT